MTTETPQQQILGKAMNLIGYLLIGGATTLGGLITNRFWKKHVEHDKAIAALDNRVMQVESKVQDL